MARKRMVTRNVHTYDVTVLCLDLETEQPCQQVVKLPRTYAKKDMLKRAAEVLDARYKACRVLDVTEGVKRYGMLEEEFLKYAKEI